MTNLLKFIDWLLTLLFVMAWQGYLMMLLGFLGALSSLATLLWTHHPITAVGMFFLFLNCMVVGLLQRISNYALDIREELKRLNKPENLPAIGGWMTL